MPRIFLKLLAALTVTLTLGWAGQAAATETFTKDATYRNPAIKAGGSLALLNLAGTVTLQPATDGVLQVDSHIVAGGQDKAAAEQMAAKIKIETTVSGQAVSMTIHYPLDEYDSYYFTKLGNGFGMSNSTLDYEGERVTVSSGWYGHGANLHVDLVVHVPKGVKVAVDNKVGQIGANGVSAPLSFKSASGDIKAAATTGDVSADTGSGDVTVTDQTGAVDMESGSGDMVVQKQKGGDIKAHTGSGDVKLSDLSGTVTGETGSGDVVVDNFTGESMDLETGSGDVTLTQASAKTYLLRSGSGEISARQFSGSVTAKTGSGDIHLTQFKAGDSLECHAGSGEIDIDGDLGAVTHLVAGSGSGDIEIHTSTVPSLHITATSDSGDVHVDLPGMQNVTAREHSVRADVNGGKGTADLEAGSGDVTFTH